MKGVRERVRVLHTHTHTRDGVAFLKSALHTPLSDGAAVTRFSPCGIIFVTYSVRLIHRADVKASISGTEWSGNLY
jgi:hypothetical protein